MKEDNKEKFFIIFLNKPNSGKSEMKFTNPNESPPKCLLTKEDDAFIIKVFQVNNAESKSFALEFIFDEKEYKLTLPNENTEASFIFIPKLQQKINQNLNLKDQTRMTLSQKMNYFYEALNINKEYAKLDKLYEDSIKNCKKNPSFQLLINIFIKVYDTKFCEDLLNIFSSKSETLRNISTLTPNISRLATTEIAVLY